MITFKEYDRVQILLVRKGKTRPNKHTYDCTCFIHCGECGCLITAETKNKLLRSGEIREHTYYHCTRRKKTVNCSQRKVIREEDLSLQAEKELEKYTILPEFRDWTLEVLNQSNDREIKDRSSIYEMQHQTLVGTQKQLDQLTKMRYKELIDDETFIRERNELQDTISRLKERLRETESRAERWLELTEKTFNFATYARKAFMLGDLKTRKEILMALGQNSTIKDGKLTIQANEWLQPIQKRYPALEKEYLRLEPSKIPSNREKTQAFASVCTRWHPGGDSNPQPTA